MTHDAPDAQADPVPQARTRLRATRAARVIALFELAKGTFAVTAASGLELLGPTPLRRFAHWLIEVFRFDAHHSVLASFTRRIDPESVHLTAAVAAAYGVLRLVEAWGLWRMRRWASWLGCIGAALYLPFEGVALVRDPGWVPLAVVAINLSIVWILARDLVVRRRAERVAGSR
jgi:uncharacterized membrane protein (DUF2068 family)